MLIIPVILYVVVITAWSTVVANEEGALSGVILHLFLCAFPFILLFIVSLPSSHHH